VTDQSNQEFIDADTMSGQIRPIRRVVFSLGSNVGDREVYLQDGLDSLLEAPAIRPVAVSPVYQTAPLGGSDNQDDYYNAVLVVDTDLPARTILERCLAVEEAYGRERSERWGPRTLDIDVIVIGDRRKDDADFVLPHPRAHERAFVLAPWLAIDPEAEIPGRGAVRDLLADLDTSSVTALADVELHLPE
jgi:2-amino-4-hydroxy-6-hydroxymethyldihydropteridine diphosphokinase